MLGGVLLLVTSAHAGMEDPAVTVGPELSLLGPASSITGRPGLRLGFEPNRRMSGELFYSVMFAAIWHAGVSPEVRWFPGEHPRNGVYLAGRMPLGLIGDMPNRKLDNTASTATTDSTDTSGSAQFAASSDTTFEPRLGAAVAAQVGVGWRFAEFMGVELTAGPEWDGIFGLNWRAGLSLEVVMHNDPDPDAPPRRR